MSTWRAPSHTMRVPRQVERSSPSRGRGERSGSPRSSQRTRSRSPTKARYLTPMARLKASYGDEAWARLGREERKHALETLQQMDKAMGVGKPQQPVAGAVATPAVAPPPRQRVEETESMPITASVDESDSGGEDEREEIAAPRQPQDGALPEGEAHRESLEAASVHALLASGEDSADEGVPPRAQAAPPRDRASSQQPKKSPKKKPRQNPKPKQKPKKKVSARRKSRPRSISPRDYRADEEFVRQKKQQLQADIQTARSKLCALSYGRSGAHPAVLFNRISSRPSGQATSINLQEFRNALRKDGGITRNAMSDADIEVLFQAVDQDENGAVDIDELAEFVWPGEAEKKQQALRGAERLGISRAAAPPTKRYEMDARVEKFMANFGDLSAIRTINPDRSLYGGVRSVRSASPGRSVPRVAHPTMYTGATRQTHAEQARSRTPGRNMNGQSPERVAHRHASTGKQRTRSAGPRSRSRRSGRREKGPNTSGGTSSKSASPGRRARSAPKSASVRRSPTRPSRSDHSRSPMGTLKSQGSPPRELFLKRAEAARASSRDGVDASADALAAWDSRDSAAAANAATVKPVRHRVQKESLSPNTSNRSGVSRSSSPTHTRLHEDAQHRIERQLMAQQAEHHKKENDLVASLNQDLTFDFISRDRMLDFISRQAASEESRQEKLQLARAAGLESEYRGEPIDRVAGLADSPNRRFREQLSPRPMKHTEAWVADQAERYIEHQRMLESKTADYHAAQWHAMTRDSIILQRRADSKERGPRGSVSPSRSEPALVALAARLSTRNDMHQKTAALKEKLEKTREAELTFSPQLNPKSVKLASKRESMMELAGIDTPVSKTSPRKQQRDIHKGPVGMSPIALSPMDTGIESLPAPDPEQFDAFTGGEEGQAPDSPRTVRSTAVRRHFGVELTAVNGGGRASNSVEDAAGHAGGSDSGGSGEVSPRRQGGSPRGSLFGRHRASGSPRRGGTDSRRGYDFANDNESPQGFNGSKQRDAESEEAAWHRVQARRAAKMEEAKKEQAALQRAREAEKKSQTSATTSDGHDDLSSVSATLDAALTGSLDLSTPGIPADRSRAMGELSNLQADHDYADKLFPDGVPPMVSPTTQVSAVAAHGKAYETIATAPAEIQLAAQEQAGGVVSQTKHADAYEAEASWMSSLQIDPVDEMDELEPVIQQESDGGETTGETMQQNDMREESATAATVATDGGTTEIEPDADTSTADANRLAEQEASSAAHKETVDEEAPDDMLAGMAAELGFDAAVLDTDSRTERDAATKAAAPKQQPVKTKEADPAEAQAEARDEPAEEEVPDEVIDGLAADSAFDPAALGSTETDAGEADWETKRQNETGQEEQESATAAASSTDIERETEDYTDPAAEQDAAIANNPHLEEDLLGDDDPFAGLLDDDFLTAGSDVANSDNMDDADAANDDDDDPFAALEAMLDS